MISLFRKYNILRPAVRLAVSTGILTGLCLAAAGASAAAQVATRTQFSTHQGNGTLSLAVKVLDVEGNPISEGSVSFETEKGSLGSVFVENGAAELNLTNPPAWARSITAVYHGDATFAGSSASASVVPDATTGLAGFTVTASPSSVSLTAGQFATIELAITSQNGFNEAVNLSCSGLPGASKCFFNPDVASPPANGTISSALQITTTARSGLGAASTKSYGRSGAAYAVVIPGLLALLGLGAIRRRNLGALRLLGLAMLLTAGSLGLSACNARYSYEHYHPSPNYGTVAGNYTIVVAAYSSNGTSITQATSTDANCSGATCIALTVQ